MAKAKLTRAEVKHIAQLAQLDLSEAELKKFQKQLSEILGYAERLNSLNTSKVKPTSQVTGLENVFRPDEPKSSLSQEKTLAGAKEEHHGFFKTKGIFEER